VPATTAALRAQQDQHRARARKQCHREKRGTEKKRSAIQAARTVEQKCGTQRAKHYTRVLAHGSWERVNVGIAEHHGENRKSDHKPRLARRRPRQREHAQRSQHGLPQHRNEPGMAR
jgi:hypothetical protein